VSRNTAQTSNKTKLENIYLGFEFAVILIQMQIQMQIQILLLTTMLIVASAASTSCTFPCAYEVMHIIVVVIGTIAILVGLGWLFVETMLFIDRVNKAIVAIPRLVNHVATASGHLESMLQTICLLL
jgi:hypothetical protein